MIRKQYAILILLVMLLGSFQLQAQNGSVKGQIINSMNNQPVPFAAVQVKNTTIGTSTDEKGYFVLTGIKPGFVKLEVSSLGYQNAESGDIFVSNENIPFVEIKMQPATQNLKEVKISAGIFRQSDIAPVSMQRLSIKQIVDNPGSNRDISRVIQSLPGIGSTPNYRNDVIVRGGGPAESKFYLDGIEIPVLNHFATQGASGGPVGILNADFIQSLNYYASSFPADRGNALSGVFEFFLKEGSHDKNHFQFALGASEAAITSDGPLGKKTSYIFSVRRSYLQFLFSAIGLPFLPTFTDYQLKTKTQFNSKNQLTIISLGSYDQMRINTGIKNPDAAQQYILSQIPVNNQWSYTIGANFKHFTKNGFHTFVLSRSMLYNQLYKYPDNNTSLRKSLDYESKQSENRMRYEFNYLKNGFKVNLSANLDFLKYYNTTTQEVYSNDSSMYNQYETLLKTVGYGFSGQVSKKFMDDRITLSMGIRFDGNNYNSAMSNPLHQVSPRFAVSYRLSEKILLSASMGHYSELPAATTLGFKTNGAYANKTTATYITANHYNLGISYRPSKPVFFQATGFYKAYNDYPIDLLTGSSLANEGANYSSVVGNVPVVFNGKGKAYGFELVNRLNFERFNLIASYTFVRSLFSDLSGEYIPSAWDSKNLLTLTGSQSFQKNWQVGFKWRFVGGLPYTPYDLSKSALIQAWDATGQPYLNYAQLNADRLPSFQQLDLRIDKKYFFKKWSLWLYLDVQNAYNFQYKGQNFVIREKGPDGNYLTTNNNTEYVLKQVPNVSGTVLPTVGIIIGF
ncbi:MAG: TonB-dependent receptor [Bacteroidales bacterium]|nr:TonB-dependent receptor [Bacteroidales bacterium]